MLQLEKETWYYLHYYVTVHTVIILAFYIIVFSLFYLCNHKFIQCIFYADIRKLKFQNVTHDTKSKAHILKNLTISTKKQ